LKRLGEGDAAPKIQLKLWTQGSSSAVAFVLHRHAHAFDISRLPTVVMHEFMGMNLHCHACSRLCVASSSRARLTSLPYGRRLCVESMRMNLNCYHDLVNACTGSHPAAICIWSITGVWVDVSTSRDGTVRS